MFRVPSVVRHVVPATTAIVVATAIAVIAVVGSASCAFSLDRTNGLEPGSVQGRVVDENGAPVAFAVVARDGSPAIARTNKDGTFTIRGLTAGPVALHLSDDVDGDSIAELAAIRTFSIDAFLDPATHTRTLSAVLLGDVALALTTSVKGHVFDNSGNPAAGAVVVVYRRSIDLTAAEVVGSAPPQDLGIEARTAAADDGSFVIPGVAPGAATIAAFADDGSATPAHDVTVSGTTTDAGQLVLSPPSDRSVSLATSPPAHDGVVVDIVRPGGDPNATGDVVSSSGPLGGGGALSFTSPVGVWDLYAHDGARVGALTNRAAPASLVGATDVLTWGTMTFADDDPCRRTAQDRDGDGVNGLPAPQNDNDATWIACATTCAPLFGAALLNDDGTPKTCTVNNAKFDCDDDNDGQPDVTEPFSCIGLCNGGGDRDGDGICDAQDPFPLCKENDPAICKGAPAFSHPPPVYTSSGEGEGEGSIGEGEGEGEGEGSVGEGEGEGSVGEGEGEGEGTVDPCATNFAFSTQTDLVNFAALGCTHVNVLIIDSTGVPFDRVTSLAPLSALTQVAVNLGISGTDIVDADGLQNITSVGGNFSFGGNTSLASVTLPALTNVGDLIFVDDTTLQTLTWPSGLAQPGGFSCNNDPLLIDVGTLGATVTSVGTSGITFKDTSSLPRVDFPNLTTAAGAIAIDNTAFDRMPDFPVLANAGELHVVRSAFVDAGSFPSLTAIGLVELREDPNLVTAQFANVVGTPSVTILDDASFAPTTVMFPSTTSLLLVTIGGYAGSDLSFLAGTTTIESFAFGIGTNLNLPNDIASLHGLEALVEAGTGGFILNNAPQLTDVSALANLVDVRSGMQFAGIGASTISLPALTSLSGELLAFDNPSLTSLLMPSLHAFSSLDLVQNFALQTFVTAPIDAQTQFAELVVDGTQITALPDFGGVVDVLGPVTIRGNAVLTDLTGLDGIVNTGSVDVSFNDAMTSFGTGFASLTTVTGTFSVTNNPSLSTMPTLPNLAQATEIDLEAEPFPDGGTWPALTTLDHVELVNLPNLTTLPSLPALITALSAYNITSTGITSLPCLPPATTIGVSSNHSLVGMNCATPQTIGTMGFTDDPALQGITATLTAPLQGLRLDLMTIEFVGVPIADNAHDVQLVNSSVPTLDTFMSNVTSLLSLDIENTNLTDLNGLGALTTVTTDFVIDLNGSLCNTPLPQDVLDQLSALPSGTVVVDPNCTL